jgi:hypothetical protein
MSRAFVKQPEGDDVVLERPLRQHSDLPNDITAVGINRLQEKITALEKQWAIPGSGADPLGAWRLKLSQFTTWNKYSGE